MLSPAGTRPLPFGGQARNRKLQMQEQRRNSAHLVQKLQFYFPLPRRAIQPSQPSQPGTSRPARPADHCWPTATTKEQKQKRLTMIKIIRILKIRHGQMTMSPGQTTMVVGWPPRRASRPQRPRRSLPAPLLLVLLLLLLQLQHSSVQVMGRRDTQY